MNITVLSKKDATEQTFDEPYIHISIRSPYAKKPVLSSDPNRLATLFLVFHDVERIKESYQAMTGRKVFMMTPRHAELILRFVRKWQSDIKRIVVNCEAGISRSAGVAAALAVYFEVDDSHIYKGRYPNTHVKTLLLKTMAKTSTAVKYRRLLDEGWELDSRVQ